MKSVQFMWNIVKQYFYQKEMSGSEEEVFLTLEAVLDRPPRQIFMSVVQKGTLKTRMFADRRWRCRVKFV